MNDGLANTAQPRGYAGLYVSSGDAASLSSAPHLREVAKDVVLSVVVPTRNEAGNIAELLRRIDEATRGLAVEVVIVDDSDDDTPQVVHDQMGRHDCDVRLHHRDPADRVGGLGTAVVAGFTLSRGTWIAVMDGDLQHPPSVLLQMLAAATATETDLVVASRYIDGGSTGGLADAARVFVSGGATTLTKRMFPRRMRHVSDPMSGFFLVRAEAVDPEQLRPHGFKILLDLVVRTPGLRITEVPFTFEERFSGTSNASFREGFRFLRLLLTLRLAVWGMDRRLLRPAGFAAVGASGLFVNGLALWVLSDHHALGIPYVIGAALATQVSTAWNFTWSDALVFRGEKHRRLRQRFLRFAAINNSALLLRLPALWLAVEVLGVPYLIGNALTFLVLFVARFGATDRIIYTPQGGLA